MPRNTTSLLKLGIQHPVWSHQVYAAASSGMLVTPFPQEWMQLIQETNIRNIRRKIYATSATPVLSIGIPANDNMPLLP